jgi:hypothetical protein
MFAAAGGRSPTALMIFRLVSRLNDRVRVDHRFTHPYEPVTESLRAHALCRDARAFEQQEQFFRQHVRLGERSRGAQLNKPLALIFAFAARHFAFSIVSRP